MTHRFTVTSDESNVVSVNSLEEWRAGLGIGLESPFEVQLGDATCSRAVICSKADLGASGGALGALNYSFDNPANDTESKLIEDQISKWILSMAIASPASVLPVPLTPFTLGEAAGACRALVEEDSTELGQYNHLSPRTIGLYAQAAANIGYSSKFGTLNTLWPLGFDSFVVAGSAEADGKINAYTADRVGFEVDLSFSLDADVSFGPLRILGISNFGRSLSGEASVELVYDSGHISSLEIGFGVSAQKSALQGLIYSGLLFPLNGVQLPASLPDLSNETTTVNIHYSVPIDRFDSEIQSDLKKLAQGDLSGGIFGLWQDVNDSMKALPNTPIPYEITAGSESNPEFKLEVLHNSIDFTGEKSITSVIETGFALNFEKWPLATYANMIQPIFSRPLDFILKYWHIENLCSDFKTLANTTVKGVNTLVKIAEGTHHLYLHATDKEGRHTGLNYTTGQVEIQIPGSFYIDHLDGITYVGLPDNLTNYVISVDATYAQQNSENYNLTLVSLGNEHQAPGVWESPSTIYKGSTQRYTITSTQDMFTVNSLPGLRVSQFLTDANSSSLSKNPSGSWKVDATFANGVIEKTSPTEILVWTNISSTGPAPIRSLQLDETLPPDWRLSPQWTVSHNAVHVYFEYSNKTRIEITQGANVMVQTGNPEQINIQIPDLTATSVGKALESGEAVVFSVKLAYALVTTNQLSSSFPRSYSNTASVKAFTGASYSLLQTHGESGTNFTTEAVVLPNTAQFPWWQLYLSLAAGGIPIGIGSFLVKRRMRKRRVT